VHLPILKPISDGYMWISPFLNELIKVNDGELVEIA